MTLEVTGVTTRWRLIPLIGRGDGCRVGGIEPSSSVEQRTLSSSRGELWYISFGPLPLFVLGRTNTAALGQLSLSALPRVRQ